MAIEKFVKMQNFFKKIEIKKKENRRYAQKIKEFFKRFAENLIRSNIYKIIHKKRVVVFLRKCILKAQERPK